MDCRHCGGPLKTIEMPEGHMHYAKTECLTCGRFNGWVPKPKNEGKRRDKNTTWRAKWRERGFVCAFCGATEEDYPESSQWQLDHIITLESGGLDEFTNTMMLCTFCHTTKNLEQKRLKAIKRVREMMECQKESDSIPW